MVLHELAFQFTPLREGRHRKKMRKRALHDFNSRPSARGDGLQCGIILSGQTFQFTPLREGRLGKANQVCCRLAISIHAPPRGATAPVRAAHQHNGDFNSRPSARGDCPRRDGIRQERLFQFTPLREGRRWLPSRPSQAHHFNSRPSARGDVRCPSPRYAS